jgi:hypothetical protein
LFNDFEEWFDCEHQRIEQERFLQQQLNHQRSIINLKKIRDEDVSCTDDLRDVFPNYYDKPFLPFKKGDRKDFIFFKYSTNNGKVDDYNEKEEFESEEQSTTCSSEELESKDLLLKEIELLFENVWNTILILRRCSQSSRKIINQKLISSTTKF